MMTARSDDPISGNSGGRFRQLAHSSSPCNSLRASRSPERGSKHTSLARRAQIGHGRLKPGQQRSAHEYGVRFRIVQQPAPLRRGYLCIERDDGSSREVDPDVSDHPFRTIFGKDGDPCALLQAESGQSVATSRERR